MQSAPFTWTTFLAGLISFVLGWLSSYILQRSKEKRESRLRLTREVHYPLHKEVYDVRRHVERRTPQDIGASAHLWQSLKSQGRSRNLEETLCKDLDDLHSRLLIEYDKAWRQVSIQELQALLQKWDRQHGRPPAGVEILDVDWWAVATNENYRVNGELLPNQVLRINDWVVGQAELSARGLSIDAFIQQRRCELAELPAVASYGKCRKEILGRCDEILRALKAVFYD